MAVPFDATGKIQTNSYLLPEFPAQNDLKLLENLFITQSGHFKAQSLKLAYNLITFWPR
jgi:hypothetical protein